MAIVYGSSITGPTSNVNVRAGLEIVSTTDHTTYITVSYKLYMGYKSTTGSTYSWSFSKACSCKLTVGSNTITSVSYPSTTTTLKAATDWKDVAVKSGSFTVDKTTTAHTVSIKNVLTPEGKTTTSTATTSQSVQALPQYTVTFKNRTGGTYTTRKIYYGNTVTKPANPTEAGYTFIDWYTDSDLTNVATFPTTITNDKAFYSKWDINSYTLTINPNGGTWNGNSTVTTYTQDFNSTKSIAEPVRPGFKFLGWAENGPGHLNKINQTDPSFYSSSGGVGVYNNSGGGTVVHTRQTSSISNTLAFGTYEILIETTSGTTSPGNGGFYQPTTSAANQKYMHIFVAKIPVGYNVMNAQNATGDGRTIQWLTSRKGTGDYQIYAYQHNCGSTGTFSTFGHVYIEAGTKPMSWNLAYSAMTNITNGFADTYTYGAGNGRLTALWAPGVPTHVNVNGTWKTGTLWANINGTWIQPLEGWINVNGTWERIK